MLLKTIGQRLSGKSGFESGARTQVKVVALMRWEWQANHDNFGIIPVIQYSLQYMFRVVMFYFAPYS